MVLLLMLLVLVAVMEVVPNLDDEADGAPAAGASAAPDFNARKHKCIGRQQYVEDICVNCRTVYVCSGC